LLQGTWKDRGSPILCTRASNVSSHNTTEFLPKYGRQGIMYKEHMDRHSVNTLIKNYYCNTEIIYVGTDELKNEYINNIKKT
jgi:hypothetical protein